MNFKNKFQFLPICLFAFSAFASSCGMAKTEKDTIENQGKTQKTNLNNKNQKMEVITLGAGCFWCIESIFQNLKGVEKVLSGYSNGQKPNPTYKEVCTGTTGHAEVAQITFDPSVVSLSEVLEKELLEFQIAGFVPVGDLVLKSEVVSAIEYLIPISERQKVKTWFSHSRVFEMDPMASGPFLFSGFHTEKRTLVRIFFSGKDDWSKQSFLLNSTDGHWKSAHEKGVPLYKTWKKSSYNSDSELYELLGKGNISPELRTGRFEWNENFPEKNSALVSFSDLKGCLHNHSKYSDGKNTIEEMANWCIEKGWEYFGIADHSKSAQYANGLFEETVEKQWKEIDNLNQKYKGFKILKGIESDILSDGSLDYASDILKGFDYVVSSVHSSMKMDLSTATQRLIKAIENPFTTILGHCSGRILLKRPGYPLEYQKIIDACIANKVVIEINAHPSRLDMDWENLSRAIEKGAMISINPDAHEREGMQMMEYGTYMARKAGAEISNVLNALSLEAILDYIKNKKGN